MKFAIYTLLCFICCTFSLYSQKGKNGAGNITAVNTKINEFTALTINATAGTAIITVAASGLNTNSRFSAALAPGDLVLLIQMQGALMKLSPVPVWAPDSTYGNVYSYETCGNYEFAEVKSIISSTQIELMCGLSKSYSAAGKTQVVRLPRYSSLTIGSTGGLTTDAWNGTIGGVLTAEVDGNTVINTGGTISVTGLGFRGGVAVTNSGSANGNFATKNPNDGAEKGEGIGSDRLINSAATNDTLGKQCKGAPANGGGGGNANNCGGGGGGNGGNMSIYSGLGVPNTTYSTAFNLEFAGRASVVSSGGGKGGYGTSTVNGNPSTNAPNNPFWGGFERPKYGGFGGRPLDYSTGRIFMGGGGGAGHKSVNQSNGTNACTGGAGGGIVFLLNYGTISGSGIINSNGANGFNAFGNGTLGNPTQGIDGAGGAGAGGTIILKSNGVVTGITANANGGTGGNQVITGALTNEGQGPGGGGSGGFIAANGSVFPQNVNGGTNGITNAVAFVSAFPMNGATSGNVGSSGQVIPAYSLSLTSANSATICANQSVTISAISTEPGASIQWYNTATAGNAVSTGTLYTTPVFATPGTYTVYAGSCPGIYRLPVTITVNSSLNITVGSPTICSGQSTVLTASGATTYSWVAGPNTNTISVSPSATTVYTVTGTSGSCNGTQTSTVTVGGSLGLSVPSATMCKGTGTTISASGATTYTWNNGATTSSLSINPLTTTIYTVTGSVGSCTGTATATVTVFALPSLTLAASPPNICNGQTVTLTASGAATYTWSNGFIGSSQTDTPLTSTNYTVYATTSNGCTNTIPNTVNVSVYPAPSITLNNPNICTGQTAILTPTGTAFSYSWSTSQITSTISVSPVNTTVYTLTATASGCSTIKTATVTVNPSLSINVLPAFICAGTGTVLTANGATSYTWSTGANTNSINVSPGSTTMYTVIGSNGSCTGTGSSTVFVNPGPILILTASPPNICNGQSTTLSVSGANTYTWSNSFMGSTQTVSPVNTITYSLTATDGSGCSNSMPASITIVVTPTPTISVNSATICSGNSATLTANGATSYTWSTGETTSVIHPSPQLFTTYTVSGSNGGCSKDAEATIDIVASPLIAIANPVVTNSCSSICINFTDISSSPTNIISYSFGDGTSAGTSNPSHCYTTTGSYTVMATAIDPLTQCATTYILPVPITVNGKPTASFTISENIPVLVGSTINMVNQSVNATHYNWTYCNGASTSVNASALLLDTGKCCIRLIALTDANCNDSIIQCISVIDESSISIPNVFTPNSDTKNDLFKIKTSGVKSLTCSIFDRWGIKLYEWEGINGYWDGKAKSGALAVDGSYFYIINYTDFKDVSKTEKGFLSLFRD